ncbi:hypothetical protein CAPTEDRAFT_208138 [Capitella teleta]|uniref:BHLH domain-containing protein n=1 Tax=Capitella teleta TaxID=283909 RepID=R7T4Q1_CAPTE|nr:hypothetical protein CAPTEDRAFT_208138 [Capitella teleta]|eukprot:ELT87836.1 hypothetical protein CAPTEDRAFT_208138 [Capitella teleta]
MADTITEEIQTVATNEESSVEASDQVAEIAEDNSQPEDPIPIKPNSFIPQREVVDALFQENFANYSPDKLADLERRYEEQNTGQLYQFSDMDLAELPEFSESKEIEAADVNGTDMRQTTGCETPTGRPKQSRSGIHPPVIKYYMNSLTKKLTSLQKTHEDRMQAQTEKEQAPIMDERDVPEPGTIVHVQHNPPNPLLQEEQPEGIVQQMTMEQDNVQDMDQQQCLSQFRDLLRMPESLTANQLAPLQGMSNDISQDEVAEAAAFLQRMDPGWGGSDPYGQTYDDDRSSIQVAPQPYVSSTPYGSQRSEDNLTYPSPCADLNYLTPINKVGQHSMNLTFDPSSGWENSSSSLAASSILETPSQPTSSQLLNSTGSVERTSSSQESAEGSGSISEDFPTPSSQNPLQRPPGHLKLPTASQLNDAVFNRVQICIDQNNSCYGNDNREILKSKERMRRSRMKDACDKLRRILPLTTQKVDKASMLERAASYICYLQSCLGSSMPQLNQDYLANYD